MTCAACAGRVERSLNRLGGVEAGVNYATELAAVRYDPARITVAELVDAVERAGYEASLPRASSRQGSRMPTLRLAAATTLTIPLVLVAMIPPLQFPGWEWLALALAAPVVLWCGWPFHRAAFANLRHGAATMDTLVSVGTLAALLWSVVALVTSDDAHTYFEVGAVITTLILLGRYLESRARRRSGEAIRSLLELGAKEANVHPRRRRGRRSDRRARGRGQVRRAARREDRDRRHRRRRRLGGRPVDAHRRAGSGRGGPGSRRCRRDAEHLWPARRSRNARRRRHRARPDHAAGRARPRPARRRSSGSSTGCPPSSYRSSS